MSRIKMVFIMVPLLAVAGLNLGCAVMNKEAFRRVILGTVVPGSYGSADGRITVVNHHNEVVPYAIVHVDKVGDFTTGPDGSTAIIIPPNQDVVSGSAESRDGDFHQPFKFGVSRDPSKNNWRVVL